MSGPAQARRVRQKDWVLGREAFQRFLSWLDPEPRRAAELYGQIHAKLVRFFQWRGCAFPEDCADRTCDRVARRLQEGQAPPDGNPQAYLYGVALNVWREQLRESAPGSLDASPEAPGLAADPEEQLQREAERTAKEHQLACLEKCVRRLPVETRRLLVSYHCAESKKAVRQELAAGLGVSLELLRTRVYRVRLVLERCTRACLSREVK